MLGTKEVPSTGDHLEIKDSRTGKSYTVPITDDTIRTSDLKQIKVDAGDFGMMGYDPAFMNTASCRSAITFIDGDKGILRYRGRLADLRVRFIDDTGAFFDAKPYPAAAYRDQTPLMHEIRREGLDL